MAHVLIHVAVSLDGATTGFTPDIGTFYSLVRTWEEDITLCGADTILAQDLSQAPQPGPHPDGALLLITDSRGRIDAATLATLRNVGHWRDARVVRDRDLRAMVAGQNVRVDSGGALSGALLREGLVDEVSLLVHPRLVGGDGPRWFGDASPQEFELRSATELGGGLAWLRLTCATAGSAS